MEITEYQRTLLEAAREKLNELNMENNLADEINGIDDVIDSITEILDNADKAEEIPF